MGKDNTISEIENAIKVLTKNKDALGCTKMLLQSLYEAKGAARELCEILNELPSSDQLSQKEN